MILYKWISKKNGRQTSKQMDCKPHCCNKALNDWDDSFSAWLKSLTLFQTKTLSLVVQTAEKPSISAQDLLKKKSITVNHITMYYQYKTEPHFFFNSIQTSWKKKTTKYQGTRISIDNTGWEFLLLIDIRGTLQYQYRLI